MLKRIAKISTGVATGLAGLYWSVAPAWAIAATNLCPTSSFGMNIPGCGGNAPTISKIIQFGINLLLFVAFIVAFVFLIIGGIRWIMSGGDKEGTAKAKGTVTAALIGLVVVIAAWVLMNIIVSTLTGGNIGNLNVGTL